MLVLHPQQRDRDEVRAAALETRYDVRWHGGDLDAGAEPARLGALPAADGAVGTKDRSALLASLATGRPSPASVIACQHKPTSRTLQRKAVPEAVPRFALVDGSPLPWSPPFFVKPVVGRLSQGARRVDRLSDLESLRGDAYAAEWAELATAAGFARERALGFMAEELLEGDEVTLEGYVHDGRVTVIGITDSVKYPGTNSFERFEYPSTIGDERRAEIHAVAERLLPSLGFDGGFFNLELVVPARGRAKILEVNGRIASQFAPLVRLVHGRSTYDALFALAVGRDPLWEPSRPDGVAVSHVVRRFEDAYVDHVPDAEDGVEILVCPGRRLSEQRGPNDTASYRLAIVYEAGETRAEAVARARERARRLDFRLL